MRIVYRAVVHSHSVTAVICFFFNDAAPTEIYPLSLHDALPISPLHASGPQIPVTRWAVRVGPRFVVGQRDRKSTRLNPSHLVISYARFCLKKKKKLITPDVLKTRLPCTTHTTRAERDR